MNQLILGDNLEILQTLEPESVDLIYLDPPFFSNRNYEVIWGDSGEVRSFEDRWAGGIRHYIGWLEERVQKMYPLLKPTGSIFLHCDWHANAYIRTLILDKIFGENNFRNEIIWCYSGPANSTKAFPQKHDTIYRYSKSEQFIFNKNDILIPYDESTLKRRSYTETKKKGIPFQGKPEEEYLKGRIPFDWWTGINSGGQMSSKERIGYPTQKPEALLERIIKCASNEGDLVLDPFIGGGTTAVVADRLGRRWIGIDQSVQAISVSAMRLDNARDLTSQPFEKILPTYDYNVLRNSDAFEFEDWIVRKYGGTPNVKKRGDKGLDGKSADNIPIQVKRQDEIGRNVVDNFLSAIRRDNPELLARNIAEAKPAGYIIAFSFGKGLKDEVARLKQDDKIIIKLVPVNEIIEIKFKPTVSVDVEELANFDKERVVALTATAKTDSKIELYSWDFEHDPEKGFRADVYIGKINREERTFKSTGTYSIACKVTDSYGYEGIETFIVAINGVVQKNKMEMETK
ncbi:hypothetical protein FACS1894172_10230 [Spirochaetia bacterium]|nr:hypothetical protein FACS1894164_13050 [Spirochaetia bacterium]GHU32847.1 hypothetical protein FACS1894172_10230 [Spirochaetia bacterium]